MNPGQQRFHDFLMSMVQPGNEAAAQAILAQNFAQQDAGGFAPANLDSAVAQLKPLVKPEAVAELQNAADRMKQMATHGPGDHPHGDHPFGDHDHGEHMMHRDDPSAGTPPAAA